MTTNTSNKEAIFSGIIKNGTIAGAAKSGVKFVNSDGTSVKTLYTAGSDGAILENICAHSDDTAAVIVLLSISDGTTTFPLGELTVAIGAGTDGGTTPSQNLLLATALGCLRTDGSLMLAAGSILQANVESAVTATKTLTLFPIGSDF